MEIDEITPMAGVEDVTESSRKVLAFGLLGMYVVFMGATLLFTLFSNQPEHFDQGVSLLSTLGALLGGLLGAVMGFYFGAKD